jgi:hypothetical protein
MAKVRDDFYHLVPDAVVLKGLGQRQRLHCMCCRELYERGNFRCCAPPSGMKSEKWLEMFCPDVKAGGCGKCPKHCQCPNKAQRLGDGPLKELAKKFMDSLGNR